MRLVYFALCISILVIESLDAQTNLYVVDIGPNRGPPFQVMKYDADGQNPEVFVNDQLNGPQDILFLEDQGIALVSNFGSGRITRHDAETGAYISNFATGINGPTRIVIGPEELLYVLQWNGNGRVLRYEQNGSFVDEFTTVGVSNSIGLDWDNQGNLYVASFNQAQVRRFDPTGNDLGLFIDADLAGPTNIWFEDDGDLMVVDWSGGSIKRFDSVGAFKSTVVNGLSEPEGVEFLANGNFLIGNGGTSSVRQYTTDGVFVRDQVPVGSGGLVKPNGLRFRTVDFAFEINAGLNDAWFNASILGQGAFVTVFPDLGAIFIAVFTYDTERPPANVVANLGEPGHRWFTAFGDFAGDTAVLDIELTEGGVFNAALPGPTQTPNYGTLTAVFSDCENLSLSYEFPSLGLSGEMLMTRIALDNVARCEAFAQ